MEVSSLLRLEYLESLFQPILVFKNRKLQKFKVRNHSSISIIIPSIFFFGGGTIDSWMTFYEIPTAILMYTIVLYCIVLCVFSHEGNSRSIGSWIKYFESRKWTSFEYYRSNGIFCQKFEWHGENIRTFTWIRNTKFGSFGRTITWKSSYFRFHGGTFLIHSINRHILQIFIDFFTIRSLTHHCIFETFILFPSSSLQSNLYFYYNDNNDNNNNNNNVDAYYFSFFGGGGMGVDKCSECHCTKYY